MEDYRKLLIETIENNIQAHPEKVAYIIGEERVSYAQMNLMAERIAANVKPQISNLKPQTSNHKSQNPTPARIGICLPRHTHFVPCILAAVKLGCSYVPIDTATPAERKKFIVEDAMLDFLITEDNLSELLDKPQTSNLKSQTSNLKSQTSNSTEAYMIYTSGTTGQPKGVSLPYSALYSYLQTVSRPDGFNISERSIILQFASINFDVSVLEIFSSLYYGATLVIAQDEERHNAQLLHDMMIRHHISYCFLPPSLLAVFPDYDFPDMDTLTAGGEAVPHSLAQKIAGKYTYRFVNGYGPTENTVITTTHEIHGEDDWRNIGKPLPGVVCYVADGSGVLVKPGEKGELLIGGRQLAIGYWNRPEQNEQMFFENPYEQEHDGIDVSRLYHSGDIVTLNEDGSFDYIGRADSQIKFHGFRIEIGEIIARIEMYNRVARAFVRLEEFPNSEPQTSNLKPQTSNLKPQTSNLKSQTSSALVAYVCTKDKRPELSDVKDYVARFLPDYMVPTFWNYVEEFTLNLNGKIDKSKLSNDLLRTLTVNDTPLTAQEEMLMNEVASILGLKAVNVECDLIDDLGLSSIQTMTMIADLNTVGVYINTQDVTRYRSIRQILKNSNSPDHYWFNDDDDTQKPVIVCIAGFTGFSYMYTQIMEQLKDDFSIYVLESYHLIIGNDRMATADELADLYMERLKPIADKHEIAFITGICYGGEQALYLAHKMFGDKPRKPAVVCLDGEVDRDMTPEKNPVVYFPFFSEAVNKHRTQQDDYQVLTLPDFHYQGKVVSFVCSEFVDCYSYLDPNPTEYKVECMKEFLRTSPARWKARYPDCEVIMYPTNHDLFWRTEPSLTMTADCFRRVYKEQTNFSFSSTIRHNPL